MASSGAIKGINIALGADATKFTKALKDCNSKIKTTQTELNEVNKALKFNPKNVTLLTQKAGLLERKIADTKNEADTLRNALAEMRAKGVDETSDEFMRIERAIIEADSKLENFNEELIKTKAAASNLGQLGAKFSEVGKQATELGNKLKYVSAAAAGALGFAVKSASDLEESMNKVNVAFGSSSDEVNKFAKTTITQFGIAEGSALDMAATFGDMGTSMGLSRAEAAKMSTGLVGLAGDLASFKNIGIDRAATALNGIFTGETESLKSLGIVMTQTNLDAFALSHGFGKTTDKMTEAEKVSLRYAYVLNATKNAQGDFARTNDGFANQLRMLQEGLKQVAASLGEVVLPLAAKVLSVANAILVKIMSLSKGSRAIIAAILGVTAAAAPLLLTFGKVAELVGSSLTVFSQLAVKLPILSTAFKGLTGVLAANPIIAVAAAIAALAAVAITSRADINKLGESIANMVTNFMTKAAEIIPKVVEGIANNMPQIIEAASQIIVGLITGLANSLPVLVKNAPKIVKALAKGIIASIPAIRTAGVNIIKGLWSGAQSMVNWVVEKFKGLGKKILKGIKNALGIHSPSRVFRDEVGKNIVLGIADGITDNGRVVDAAMSTINGKLSTAPITMQGAMQQNIGGNVSIIFNGSYSFMNDEQINAFMQRAEQLTKRRLATC